MLRILFIVSIFCLSTTALAQTKKPVVDPCAKDIAKFCAGAKPGGYRCIMQRFSGGVKLSKACDKNVKAIIAKGKARRAAAKKKKK